MNNIVSFYLAGLQFRPIEDTESIAQNMILKLEAEPDNPYDGHAIKVLTESGKHIGYIPKKVTQEVHPYRLCEIPVFTKMANYIPEMPSHKRCLITIKSVEPLPKFIPMEKESDPFQDFINLDKLVDE